VPGPDVQDTEGSAARASVSPWQATPKHLRLMFLFRVHPEFSHNLPEDSADWNVI
jgi:hypothetical protein